MEIVNKAEEDIQTARDNAETAKAAAAAVPGAVAAIEAQLQTSIASIVGRARGEAMARDAQGAATVSALSTDIAEWTSPFVNNQLPESGGIPDLGNIPATPPPTLPKPQDGNSFQVVDNTTFKESPLDRESLPQQDATHDPKTDPQRGIQENAMRQPDKIDPSQAAAEQPTKPTTPSSPPATSAPWSGSAHASNPGSMIGQMFKPASSAGSSPASLSPVSSSSGSATNPASAAQSSQLTNANAANAASGANAAAAGRAPGLASLGSGLAESSARMASGAINTATNAMGTAANVGSNVAQNVASAAAQAPAAPGPAATTAPAATTSAAAAPPAGGAPMAMMPPAGAIAPGPVNPVTGGLPAGGPNVGGATPTTPAAAQQVASGSGSAASSASGAAVAPLAMPGSPIRGIGADGATGDALFDQAMDAGREVVAAMIAQTVGYIEIDYAVSLIWERTGSVSAWMATSEGASYIPLGVRVPQDVRLSVTDPVVGRELWEATAAAGGADPLEVVVRQAEAREQAAPGARVLAIASTLPMARVIDWAGAVGARPVSVDPKKVAAAADVDGSMLHRCAVAMAWEWRQANAFTQQDRLKVAARHMHMAATAGHLSGRACETVMRLFEERKPIDHDLWYRVHQERFEFLTSYMLMVHSRGLGGSEPARALATARAAEVIECLRYYDTAEGCADLLYATRLAGAPLNPAAAVA